MSRIIKPYSNEILALNPVLYVDRKWSKLNPVSGNLQDWYGVRSTAFNANQATVASRPTIGENAIEFDGVNNYIEFADSDDLSFVDVSGDLPFSMYWEGDITLGSTGLLINKDLSPEATAREYSILLLNDKI